MTTTREDRMPDAGAEMQLPRPSANGAAAVDAAVETGESVASGKAAAPLLDKLPTEELMAKADVAAGLMKALSNPCRLLILCMLSDGEKTVSELEQHLHTKQPNVSQQLARLRHEGLVGARREGRMMYYHLADDRVRGVLSALYDAYCSTESGKSDT